MQDDIAKLNDNINQARDGCYKIHNTLMRKQLSVNHDKCKYLIVGPKKFREITLSDLERDPLNMGGLTISHAEKGKGEIPWRLDQRTRV